MFFNPLREHSDTDSERKAPTEASAAYADPPQQQEEVARGTRTHTIYTLLRCSTSIIAPRGPQLLLPLAGLSPVGFRFGVRTLAASAPLRTRRHRA